MEAQMIQSQVNQSNTNSTTNKRTLRDTLVDIQQSIVTKPQSISVRSFIDKIYEFKEPKQSVRQFINDIDQIVSVFDDSDPKKPSLGSWITFNLNKIVTLIRYLDDNKKAKDKLNNVENFVKSQETHVVNEADLINIMDKDISENVQEHANLEVEEDKDE